MNIESLKKHILNLDLYKWKLIQTNLDSLVIFKSKYKYTDCIYMNIDINKTEKETEAAEYQYVMYDVSLFTALMMNKKRCLMNL